MPVGPRISEISRREKNICSKTSLPQAIAFGRTKKGEKDWKKGKKRKGKGKKRARVEPPQFAFLATPLSECSHAVHAFAVILQWQQLRTAYWNECAVDRSTMTFSIHRRVVISHHAMQRNAENWACYLLPLPVNPTRDIRGVVAGASRGGGHLPLSINFGLSEICRKFFVGKRVPCREMLY